MSKTWEIAPDAVAVDVLDGFVLRVQFRNGEIRDFFAEQQLFARKCYSSLRNVGLFRQAHIFNGTVVWNDEIDIDPEWLYDESIPV